MRERQTEPRDQEMDELMRLKRTARWTQVALFLNVALLFGLPLLCIVLEISMPAAVLVSLFLLMFLMIIVSELAKGRAQKK